MKRLLLVLTLSVIGLSAYGQGGRQNVGFLPIPTVGSSAKEASHVLKASAGLLCSLSVTSDSDQYILIMDAATVPGNGAVTLLYPPIHVAAASTTMIQLNYPLQATAGISVCSATSNSFTKTLGNADCIFKAQVLDR